MFPAFGTIGLFFNRASDVVSGASAELLQGDVPAVSTMVDAKGNVIAWLYSQRRFEVPGDKIANTMKLAIVSIEDKRFADHHGVDWKGLSLITHGRALQHLMWAAGSERLKRWASWPRRGVAASRSRAPVRGALQCPR